MAFYRKKICLVTGGTGFVGSHIVDRLLEAGAQVRAPIHSRSLHTSDGAIELINADLTQPDHCLKCCEDVDYVFHAAGSVGAAGVSENHALNSIALNLTLTANILQAASAAGVKRILLFSSSTAYPPAQHPVKEEEFWSGEPFAPYHGYAWMRRYVEKLAEYVHSSSNLNVAIVRPGAVYGPRDNFDLATCHVVPALIRKIVEGLNPLQVWGDGNDIRDLLHIDDLARGCLLAIEKKADCDPVNIAYGSGVSVRELVDIIVEEAGNPKIGVEFDSDKPSALPIRLIDIDKAGKELGFKPRISIQEGIRNSINWYKANSSNGVSKVNFGNE